MSEVETKEGVSFLGDGPLPTSMHGMLEYLVGLLLVVAPFLLSFESDGATAAAVVGGVLILAFTASSNLPTGLVRAISRGVHAALDLVIAVLLIAAPFVLGFRSEGAPTTLFLGLGVVHLLVTIATRFSDQLGRGRVGQEEEEAP